MPMSPRIFSTTQREELRIKMLDAGFELIKQHGMTHASVEKITQAAGLGKSTFYNFFSSKEEFVTDIMEYQRDRVKQHFEQILNGREKMTAAEGKEYLKLIVFSRNSIYQYLTAEDMEKLKQASSRSVPVQMTDSMTSGRPRSCTACLTIWRGYGLIWTSMWWPTSLRSWRWQRSTGMPCMPMLWTEPLTISMDSCIL